MKTVLLLLLTLLMPIATLAQGATVIGLWEAYQFDGPLGFSHHLVLRLRDDGTYERFDLSCNPVRPFAQDQGTYAMVDSSIGLVPSGDLILESAIYSYSADEDFLSWEVVPPIIFNKGEEIDPQLMIGTWQLQGPDGNPTGGEISLFPDGTYFSDLDGPTERGPYHIIGSGMVHWPVEASKSKLLGVPGVWTNIHVEGDRMSYEIIDGLRISGIRMEPTLIERVSWGAAKQTTHFFQR